MPGMWNGCREASHRQGLSHFGVAKIFVRTGMSSGYHAIMRRWVWNITAGVSLGLLLLLIMICWRTNVTSDNLYWQLPVPGNLRFNLRIAGVLTSPHGVELYVKNCSIPNPRHKLSWESGQAGGIVGPDWKYLGFQIHWWEQPARGMASYYSERVFVLPYWFLCLLLALYPIWWTKWMAEQLKRKRLEAGECLTCGYNLTGNVSGICPECGKPIGTVKA
jgi:hypothetical protein